MWINTLININKYQSPDLDPVYNQSKRQSSKTENKGIHFKATVVNSTKFSILFPSALFPLSAPFPLLPAAVSKSTLCPGLHIF